MPKKKKRFISKKDNAAHFRLVHRSQKDPLINDETAPKYVLQQIIPGNQKGNEETALPENLIPKDSLYMDNFGPGEDGFYADGMEAFDPHLLPHEYDYTQHLSEANEGVFIARDGTIQNLTGEAVVTEILPPKEEGPLEYEKEIGMLSSEMDGLNYHVQATSDFFVALETGNVEGEEGFEELQDDFIVAAMRPNVSSHEEGEEEEEEKEDEENGRMHWSHEHNLLRISGGSDWLCDICGGLGPTRYNCSECDYDLCVECWKQDEESYYKSLKEDDGRTEDRVIDEQFEYLVDEYQDYDIGELDADDPELHGLNELESAMEKFDLSEEATAVAAAEMRFVNKAVDEFANRKTKFYKPGVDQTQNEQQGEELKIATLQTRDLLDSFSKEVEDDAKTIHSKIDASFAKAPREKWDCESVVTTYSNIENHPKIIGAPRRKPKNVIQLSKSGMPLEVLRERHKIEEAIEEEDLYDEGDDDYEEAVDKGKKRDKKETKEEKKARKKAVKEARKNNRKRNKELKVLYKQEEQGMKGKALRERINNPKGTRF